MHSMVSGGRASLRKSPQILLVNPWITDFAAYDFWIKPIGLLTWGSILREAGCTVRLLDCLDRKAVRMQNGFSCSDRFYGTGHYPKEMIAKPRVYLGVPRRYGRYGMPKEWVVSLLRAMSPPDLILLNSGMTYWYPAVQEMTGLLKTIFSGTPVLLGGIYAQLNGKHAEEKSGADFIVSDSEILTVADIVKEVIGVSVDPAQYTALENRPWPDYSLYPDPGHAALLTGTGCPFRCPFCASHLLHPKFERRSPESVYQRIVTLFQDRRIRDVAFYDDALLVDADHHLGPICERIIRKGIPMRFHTPNGMHPRWVTPELARIMMRAGFKTLRLSYESKRPDRQKEMGFKVSDDALEKAAASFMAAGAKPENIGGYVMMGLPEQPIEEVIESLLYVFGLGIRVSLASFSPIPGTVSWNDAVDRGLIRHDMDPLLTNNSIFPLIPEQGMKRKLNLLNSHVSHGNQMIVAGKSPLSDMQWMRSLDELVKGA